MPKILLFVLGKCGLFSAKCRRFHDLNNRRDKIFSKHILQYNLMILHNLPIASLNKHTQ
jgi:hypothetical protein